MTDFHQIKPKIMIIDDDEFVIEMLAASIESSNIFQVIKCSSASEAFDRLSREIPDLIILDLLLGDMGGVELIRKLKLQRETHDLPLIVLSGSDEVSVKKEALEAGAAVFLTKPVLSIDLRNHIEALIPEKSPGRKCGSR